jgi:hypothetical protein
MDEYLIEYVFLVVRKNLFLSEFCKFIKTKYVLLIQHCFICRYSDALVSEDAGIELRTVEILEFAARNLTIATVQ